MSCHHRCSNQECVNCQKPRRRGSFLGFVAQTLFLYAVAVFLGGTLINTGHPVAVETGRLIHTVTLVGPASHWSAEHGLKPVSYALDFLSNGVDFSRFA